MLIAAKHSTIPEAPIMTRRVCFASRTTTAAHAVSSWRRVPLAKSASPATRDATIPGAASVPAPTHPAAASGRSRPSAQPAFGASTTRAGTAAAWPATRPASACPTRCPGAVARRICRAPSGSVLVRRTGTFGGTSECAVVDGDGGHGRGGNAPFEDGIVCI